MLRESVKRWLVNFGRIDEERDELLWEWGRMEGTAKLPEFIFFLT